MNIEKRTEVNFVGDNSYQVEECRISDNVSITIVRRIDGGTDFRMLELEDWLDESGFLRRHEEEHCTFYQEGATVIIVGANKRMHEIGNDGQVRACKYCGKLFFARRANTRYCNRIIPDDVEPNSRRSITCFSHGSGILSRYKEKIDPGRFAYNKAYKRMAARVKRNSISQEEMEKWRNDAVRNLKHYVSGEMSGRDFIDWIDSSTALKAQDNGSEDGPGKEARNA